MIIHSCCDPITTVYIGGISGAFIGGMCYINELLELGSTWNCTAYYFTGLSTIAGIAHGTILGKYIGTTIENDNNVDD